MEELILKILGEIGDMEDVRAESLVRELVDREDTSLDNLWF